MASLSYHQIKKLVGDSWVFFANPTFSKNNGKFLRAELVFFDKDKKKVLKEMKKSNYYHVGIYYFGDIPDDCNIQV